jgi:hypothetical protein
VPIPWSRRPRSANRYEPLGGGMSGFVKDRQSTPLTSRCHLWLSDQSTCSPVKLSRPINLSSPPRQRVAQDPMSTTCQVLPQPAASRPFSTHPAHSGARETSTRSRNYLTLMSVPTVWWRMACQCQLAMIRPLPTLSPGAGEAKIRIIRVD